MAFTCGPRVLWAPTGQRRGKGVSGAWPLIADAGLRRAAPRPRLPSSAQRPRWSSRGRSTAMQACPEPSNTLGAILGLQHVRKFVEAAGIPVEFCVVSRSLDADASALTALATAGELARATGHRGRDAL